MCSRLAPLLLALLLTACGGGPDGSVTPPPPPPPTTGTGTLTLEITSTDRYPLADAQIRLTLQNGTEVATGRTASDGTSTFQNLPPRVRITVYHEFGQSLGQMTDVAQSSATSLKLSMTPYRPRPVVALLPVEIPAGGVNGDRSQLRLNFRVIASRASPFMTLDSSWPLGSPYLGISFAHVDYYSRRDCHLYVDRASAVPVCESWGDVPYEVEAEALAHDATGTIPMPPAPASAHSTMLIVDQSRRSADFDPHGYRSFAARNLVQRLLAAPSGTLSIAGMAGDGDATSPATLPQRPLWLPRGSGPAFSADREVLTSDIAVLEPLVGGSSTVFDALSSAMTLTHTHASPGTRTIVAMIGGVDSLTSPEDFQAALSGLRQQQAASGVRVIFVTALRELAFEDRNTLSELAAALQAPIVSPGAVAGGGGYATQTPAPGLYAALDLAADLIEGERLPTLTATVVVKADAPNRFPAGSTLRGTVYLQSDQCPFDCMEVPLEFTVRVP